MIRYERAQECDDAVLRALLRDNGMPSWVEIALQREPSFFAGMNRITDDFAVIARDGSRAIGMYTCSLQRLHINGRPCSLGYLGGLRLIPSYRNRLSILRDGYSSIARLTPASAHPFWFTSIASDNMQARKLLEAGLAGMPRYDLLNELVTLALPVSRGRRLGLWRSATKADILGLIDFYNRHATEFQCAPELSESWIRHLGIEHFLIYGQDDIEACLTIWDQTAYKQVVARSYRLLLRIARPLYNGLATLSRRVRLPASGRPFSQCYLAFAAFADRAAPRATELIRDALSYCSSEAAIIALHDRHPLLGRLEKDFKPLSYRTRLYTVCYDERPSLDGRMAQPEAALL